MNYDKIKSAVQKFNTSFSTYEKALQDAPEQGTKDFNPNDY